MNIKLKVKLKAGEVIALNKYLASTLASFEMEDIRDNPADMLILSALYELYAKVKEKAENIRLFPSRRTDEVCSVSISRTQALAVICSAPVLPETSSAMQSYEDNFLTGLLGRIHQTFLI